MSKFFVHDWRVQLRNAEASNRREWIYKFARPWIDRFARPHLSPETLQRYRPLWVLPERGFPIIARRQWANAYRPLAGTSLLIQGTGNGWDVVSWAKHHPRIIHAVDLFAFESWPQVTDYVEKEYHVKVEFHKSSLDQLGFLDRESIDLCASDAVFEHLQNLESVMRETHRIIKPDGLVYATYGPMWYCAAGDHYGRGSLIDVFNHLLLDEGDYEKYVQRYKQPLEDAQAGVRYLELDMFSRLRTEDYMKIYQSCEFQVDSLILEISRQAIRFKEEYPDLFQELLKKYPQCNSDDFIIKANFVRLKKQSRTR